MKKIVTLLFFVIFSNLMIAQTKEDVAPLSKREKRKANAEKEYQLTKDLLQNKSFVMEAYALQDKYGHRAQVSSVLNFISVDSLEAVIQVGSDTRIGPNGVGGVTAKGQISNWLVKENKKNKTFYVRMNVMTPIGIYDVNFSVSPSGKASAQLTGLSAGQLTFDGNIVPWDKTTVYEGHSL